MGWLPKAIVMLMQDLCSRVVTAYLVFSVGEPAFVALSARDAFLNQILSGGAKLVAQLRTYYSAEAAEPAAAPAEVRDRGNGVYEVDCALKTACDFEVSRKLLIRMCMACSFHCENAVQPCSAVSATPPGHHQIAAASMILGQVWQCHRSMLHILKQSWCCCRSRCMWTGCQRQR